MHVRLPWLDVEIAGADESRAALVRALIKYAVATTGGGRHLTIAIDTAVAPVPSSTPNVRYQFVEGRAGAEASVFWTTDGTHVAVDHRAGKARMSFRPAVLDAPYSTWSDLVAAPLAEHWRVAGCFPLHAAGVEVSGVTGLVVGPSGSGKTTTSLALLAGGGTWRADDKVLIRRQGRRVEAVSLYRNTNLAPATIASHPALAFALARPPIDDTNDKRTCDMHDLGLSMDLGAFRPGVLWFPKRATGARSSFRRLDATEALVRLSGQSPSSPVRERARAQHDALVALALACPAWEIAAGRDVLDEPRSLATRLTETVLAGLDRRSA